MGVDHISDTTILRGLSHSFLGIVLGGTLGCDTEGKLRLREGAGISTPGSQAAGSVIQPRPWLFGWGPAGPFLAALLTGLSPFMGTHPPPALPVLSPVPPPEATQGPTSVSVLPSSLPRPCPLTPPSDSLFLQATPTTGDQGTTDSKTGCFDFCGTMDPFGRLA